MPEINERAPGFTLPDQDGKETKLSDFRGKNIDTMTQMGITQLTIV